MTSKELLASKRAALVEDVATARELLRDPSSKVLWAISRRIEELRFRNPPVALEVAELALETLSRLHPAPTSELRFAVLAAYGSTCRAGARFDATERTLLTAARLAKPADLRRRAEIAERLAYLRADQGREAESRSLIDFFLDVARPDGGVNLGQRLTAAATVLLRFCDYLQVSRLATEALTHLRPNGDRFHLSALWSLAHASLGASSVPAVQHALYLVRAAVNNVPAGSFPWLRLRWLAGILFRHLKRFDESRDALESARAGIERRSNPFDRALLLLDLAELHLDRGAPESARDLARGSFGVLQALRNHPEAYRAMRAFYRAATELTLDRSVLGAVRDRLLVRG